MSARMIVQEWHDTLNAGQVDEMTALVHPNVEIGGPRGTARGKQVMREWFERANIRLTPLRWYGVGNQVVVEELGEWLSPQTAEVTGSQVVASVFEINGEGLITRIVRFDTLAPALEDVCLSLDDELEPV